MPITRQYNYIPGSLAKGEDVSDEFDSIISFANGLEISKLDVVGGVVSNLTVSGALTLNGVNIFNGTNTFNSDVTIASTFDLNLVLGEINFTGNGKINFNNTSNQINFAGGGTSTINFLSTGGITLGSSASITTLGGNSFSQAGLTLNNPVSNAINIVGNVLLDQLKIILGQSGGGKFEVSKLTTGGAVLVVKIIGLPVVDPLVSGQIWNNAGVLRVSP